MQTDFKIFAAFFGLGLKPFLERVGNGRMCTDISMLASQPLNMSLHDVRLLTITIFPNPFLEILDNDDWMIKRLNGNARIHSRVEAMLIGPS